MSRTNFHCPKTYPNRNRPGEAIKYKRKRDRLPLRKYKLHRSNKSNLKSNTNMRLFQVFSMKKYNTNNPRPTIQKE